MTTDYYFRMGSTHSICQDYCIAGKESFKAIGGEYDIQERYTVEYALLSDGCSGIPDPNRPGSPYTDFGSRILVRSAHRHLQDIPWLGAVPQERIISDAEASIRALGLPPSALDATLLMAVSSGQYARTFMYGDGVEVSRERETGEITYRTRRFGNNMPYYLRYTANLSQDLLYRDQAKEVTTTVGWYRNGAWDRRSETISLESLKKESGERIYGHARIDLILLMSDGVESFVGRDHGLIPLETVLTELLAFKNFSGEFLQRRCNRFLHKFCQETGWTPTDDFSIAGIYLDETP